MLQHMFYFGVVLPTALVVVFFILFLICWFKCSLRERCRKNDSFQKPGRTSHNSTQSSLVTASSGLPYPNGPPSKDYWEIDVEHDTNIDRKDTKYVPGNFSIRSDDWIYMSHDLAQKISGVSHPINEDNTAMVHHTRKSSNTSSRSSDTSSLDSHSSRPCLDGRGSPDHPFISSDRSSPESVSKIHRDLTLPLRVVDTTSANVHWSMIPNPDQLPVNYPNTSPGFEFTDRRNGASYLQCSPYAITNLVHQPATAIRV